MSKERRFSKREEASAWFFGELDSLFLEASEKHGDGWFDQQAHGFQEWRQALYPKVAVLQHYDDKPYYFSGFYIGKYHPVSPSQLFQRFLAKKEPASFPEFQEDAAVLALHEQWVSCFKALSEQSEYWERELWEDIHKVMVSAVMPNDKATTPYQYIASLLERYYLSDNATAREALHTLYEDYIGYLPKRIVDTTSVDTLHWRALEKLFTRESEGSSYQSKLERLADEDNESFSCDGGAYWCCPVEARSSLQAMEEYYSSVWEAYQQQVRMFYHQLQQAHCQN